MPVQPLASVQGSVVNTTATPVVALHNNPSRAGVVFSNTGDNAIVLTPLGDGTPVPSILLPINSNPVFIRAELMGQLATCGFIATSNAGDSTLGITELVLLE